MCDRNLKQFVFTVYNNTSGCPLKNLLCISLVFSCYTFQLNCQHQGSETYITKTYSNKTVNNAHTYQM